MLFNKLNTIKKADQIYNSSKIHLIQTVFVVFESYQAHPWCKKLPTHALFFLVFFLSFNLHIHKQPSL